MHRSADIRMVVTDVLISKTFDSSVICPAEQTCVIDEKIYDRVIEEFQRMGARLLTDEQTTALAARSFADDGKVQLEILGQSCVNLGGLAGFEASEEDKVLLAPLPTDLDELAAHPFIAEKLMPVLGVVRSPSVEHGVRACELVTEHGGLGHTSAVYATDEDVIDRFKLAIRTGRILVNAPTAVGALGGIYNSMPPTFSLGCGTWGGSNTTDNVNYRNLLNIKTVSRRQTPPQWFRVPSDTYFNPGALDNLRQLGASRPMIVTDGPTVARGVAEEVRRYLTVGAVHVFSGVEPEPTEAQIRAGVEQLERFDADAIIALGGGSVMDAAKAMRLFHESPQLSLRELSLPFLDARKRIADFPQLKHKVRLIAIPTTSGTGSEVSPAAVISVGERKVTLVDYSLVPDMAIVDPTLALTMPPEITADTGIDALTHALEAAVSIFASPYTDAFCMQAVNLIFASLPRAYRDGSDLEARTAMANAATIAGLAFSNAFVGSTTRSRTPWARGSGSRTVARTRSSCRTSCATTRRCRASSCRRRATPRTSRPRSTRRSRGSSDSAARPRATDASGCSPASTSCWPRSTSRGRWRSAAWTARSSRTHCPSWPRRRSRTRASAPTRASR